MQQIDSSLHSHKLIYGYRNKQKLSKATALVLSIDQSENLVMYVILTRTGGNQLKHVREQKRIAATDLKLTGHKNQHRRTVHAQLHVLGKHGDVVIHFAKSLDGSKKLNRSRH